MRQLICFLIKIYQRGVSPFLPARCRFYPSCSSYGIDAVKQYGVLPGLSLLAKRLLKCHPWHPGGVDCVPGKR